MASIAEIADIEKQKFEWIRPDQRSPHFTYIEYCQCYFDVVLVVEDTADIWEGINYLVKNGVLTKEERNLAASFHTAMCLHELSVDNDYDSAAILNDPVWHEVCATARKAQDALRMFIENDDDLAYLAGEKFT